MTADADVENWQSELHHLCDRADRAITDSRMLRQEIATSIAAWMYLRSPTSDSGESSNCHPDFELGVRRRADHTRRTAPSGGATACTQKSRW